jgi:hypothetical protein
MVALQPYLNPEPRSAVGVFVDGKAYAMVDQRAELFSVLEDHFYASRNGRDLHVLTISSHRWRKFSMTLAMGWTTPETFGAALRGGTKPTLGERPIAAEGPLDTPVSLSQRAALHVAVWAVAVLILTGSLMSVPTGAPSYVSIALLLATAFIGLSLVSFKGLVTRTRQRRRA